MTVAARRSLATRHSPWARALANRLAASGVQPNAVSMLGVAFAMASSLAFYGSGSLSNGGRASLLLIAATCIQLRLLCNLVDGMLAVEEGLKSKTGDIFNDLPDRIEDVLIMVGAGYAVRHVAAGVTLGWGAALVAVLTAYVRVLGGSLGLTQYFIGPMAKQHRMFTLTAAAALAAIEALLHQPPRAIPAGLTVVVGGAIVTVIRRSHRILVEARSR